MYLNQFRFFSIKLSLFHIFLLSGCAGVVTGRAIQRLCSAPGKYFCGAPVYINTFFLKYIVTSMGVCKIKSEQ